MTVIKRHRSVLVPTKGVLKLRLLQAASGRDVLGVRSAFMNGQRPNARQAAAYRAILDRTLPGALNVLPFHPGVRACEKELQALSKNRTLVAMAGTGQRRKRKKNLVHVASSGTLTTQEKLSLASEDQEEGIGRGTQLNVFVSRKRRGAVRWAVLNCHDYTDTRLLLPLLAEKIELIVIVTFNNAFRLYWEYAIADLHRLFCYVVIVNAAEIGGSGVFAPFRRIGIDKTAQFGAAGQLFTARGPADIDATIELDIAELRRRRRKFRSKGFEALEKGRLASSRYTPVVPSQHYMDTLDRPPGPPVVASVNDIETAWNGRTLRVAVAQLELMSLPEYTTTRYRIRKHRNARAFRSLLRARLKILEAQCRHHRRSNPKWTLDLLVFPEVFVPRPFASKELQAFSDKYQTTVICGVDYPDGGEPENANECFIIRPKQKRVVYRKITRSQYDAKGRGKGPRMKMLRGDALYRFVDHSGRGFGVLICYDFSHLDLIWKLNLERRKHPLDVMVIVAHNPFGNLYRSCCLADAHRFYQYVVMCNVAKYGGSGVFGPIRTSGTRQTKLEIGKGTDAIVIAELDLAGLQRARLTSDSDLNNGEFMRRPGIFQN